VGDVVSEALEALKDRDWARVKTLVHPYVRWTDAGGTTIHGRAKLLAALAEEGGEIERPPSVELRDEQIYRWRA
jgi:hypothetical protein